MAPTLHWHGSHPRPCAIWGLSAAEYSPFYGIEKGLVLQEAREFNNAHVEPRKCQQIITKLLYLLTQGEHLTKVCSRGTPRSGWA